MKEVIVQVWEQRYQGSRSVMVEESSPEEMREAARHVVEFSNGGRKLTKDEENSPTFGNGNVLLSEATLTLSR